MDISSLLCYDLCMKKIFEFLKKIGLIKVKKDTFVGKDKTADPTIDL